MALKKFGPKDVLLNTMKTHPRSEFFIFDGEIYYNNTPHTSGSLNFGEDVPISASCVSLFEMNVDRLSGSTIVMDPDGDEAYLSNTGYIGGLASPDEKVGVYIPSDVVDNGLVYPWIVYDGSGQSFTNGMGASPLSPTSATTASYYVDYIDGDVLSGSYAMSASISREYMQGMAGELMTGDLSLLPEVSATGEEPTPRDAYTGASKNQKCSDAVLWEYSDTGESLGPTSNSGFSVTDAWGEPGISCNRAKYRHYSALKTTLDSYGYMSEHYKVTASVNEGVVYKDQQEINLISIPSIFYGSKIKPGSLSLKWYYTGSLAAELRDTRQNGELIQVSGNSQGFGASPGNPDYDGTGSVAGVVLYNEGFILLTGSWALNDKSIRLRTQTPQARSPSWLYFGAGANDGVNQTSVGGADYYNASFSLTFEGTSEIQTMTMFANARRGKVNYSNNPTYLNYSSSLDSATSDADPSMWVTTSSFVFEENTERTIVNFVSSAASDYSASFKRQVYISRVGIYDDNKNLIGVATLSNPVRKAEDEDLTFKLKLDI